ncbi:MAG: hypothetical protein ACRDP6_09585 [Actinoallomurus sp.]
MEEIGTGLTVAELWGSLDALGKRDYLNDARVKVYARKQCPGGFVEWHLQAETPHVLWGG